VQSKSVVHGTIVFVQVLELIGLYSFVVARVYLEVLIHETVGVREPEAHLEKRLTDRTFPVFLLC
jgi:hypothetical protein